MPDTIPRRIFCAHLSGAGALPRPCHDVTQPRRRPRMHVNPYLIFHGQCEEAFKLYERVTGGKVVAMLLHEGSPAENHVPPEWKKKVMHARLQIGDEFLMGSDAPPDHQQPSQGYSVTLRVDTPEEAERIYHGLSEGGTIRMPLDKTFFAQKFGMFADKFGIPWMVICENPS